MRVSLILIFLLFFIVLQTLTGCAGEKVNFSLSTLIRSLNYLTSSSEMNDVSRLFIGIAFGQVQVMLGRLRNAINNTMTAEQKNSLMEVEMALEILNRRVNVGSHKANGQRKWLIDLQTRLSKSSSVFNVTGMSNLKQNMFNNCFDQMTGQNKYKKKGPCSVSIPCWKAMTEPNLDLSYLTKELQYLIFGENFNCVQQMSELSPTVPNRGSYAHIVEAVCSTILVKFSTDGDNEWESMHYENVIFCGIYGFKDFYASGFKRVNYLNSLLNEEGCVTDSVQEYSKTSVLMEMMGVVPGDCFVDRTAMTVAYLIQIFKFSIEDPTYVFGT